MSENPWWQKHGYLAGRPLEADFWLCVAPMLFTFRVMLCTEDAAGLAFYCYTHLDDAMRCFDTWDGKGPNPVEGWTRAHT